jgi:hypothetical protein
MHGHFAGLREMVAAAAARAPDHGAYLAGQAAAAGTQRARA